MKRMLIFLLAILLLAAVFIPLKLFLIGEPVDGNQLICDVQMEQDILRIHVMTPESSVALRGLRMHQDGDALHISLRKVLVSSFFRDGSKSFGVDPKLLREVYLGGKLIWSAK